MEQIAMKQKIVDVLLRNYNKNLFSSLHREQLAEEIVSNISGKDFTTDGVTENGVVAKRGLNGTPINKPKDQVEKAKVEVVKESKPDVKKENIKKAPRQAPKRAPKQTNKPSENKAKRPERRKAVNSKSPIHGGNLKKLKNK